ncbi:MAG TPA: bifunctional phosphoribosyl-AMP cyclohydrolase/phosphoribosyl-ATP diphosphatase HisIE [Polyangia bacterium]|jgi:phosphoribosyl-ATP pyrophosphohydrolase/phosphoribosyl-AMP cyclohydrolase|nr:bifunctional phosphoribosyl-AMP cyclohydrolase/phosphoribosyl-ATP diphosphatase HisIE [Polyangia bacterium]
MPAADDDRTIATFMDAVRFDADGLVPVIAQERATGTVRMMAWANREALQRTMATGLAHFYSRTRKMLWQKGESSGHSLAVRALRLDCDGDVVLATVDPIGPSCHTGATSCFFRLRASDGGIIVSDRPDDPPPVIVERVAAVIGKRRQERPEKSYVVSLLDAGFPKIAAKITEEARELCEALPAGDAGHTAHEAADLIFHTLVGLEAAGVTVDAVFAELGRRFGISGIDEKASRKK